MIAKKILEEISSKLGDTIAQSPAKDIEKNVKSLMGSAFNRMDLVTREEFDIQQQVLIKTRELLTQLEQRVAVLEAAQTTADTTVEEAVQTAEAPAAEAAQEAPQNKED
jgi:BMFP domain-containing protein YqiC